MFIDNGAYFELPVPQQISTRIAAKREHSLSRPAWQDAVCHKEALHRKENRWYGLTRNKI